MVGCLWLLSIPFLMLINAWVGSELWGWFAVPLGAPGVGVWQMMGLLWLLSFFKSVCTSGSIDTTKLERDERVRRLWILLAVAWWMPLVMWVGGRVILWVVS